MFIYILLAYLLFLLVISFFEFEKDISNPSLLFVSGYVLSTLSAIVNIKEWLIDLSWESTVILIYGVSLFVISSYVLRSFLFCEKEDHCKLDRPFKAVTWNSNNIKLFICFQIIFILVWIFYIYSFTDGLVQGGSFTERMIAFRNWNSYSTEWINNLPYRIISQFLVFAINASYVAIFYICWNVYFGEKIKKLFFPSMVVLLSIVQNFLIGARGGVVQIFFYTIILCLVLYRLKYGFFFKITLRRFILFVVGFALSCIGFYYIKSFVGRGGETSFSGFLPYITMYAGGPIPLMDMFVNNPVDSSSIWGKETFYGINFFLAKWGFVGFDTYIDHLEFRNAVNGVCLGNVYPSFRSYIYDFGFWGLTIMPVIFAYIMNYIHYKSISKYSCFIKIFIFLYAFNAFNILFDFTRDRFFIGVTPSIIKSYMILYIMKLVFIKYESK